jgi:hypothetical protein
MYRNNKKFSFLVKVLELFLRHPTLVLAYRKSEVILPVHAGWSELLFFTRW